VPDRTLVFWSPFRRPVNYRARQRDARERS